MEVLYYCEKCGKSVYETFGSGRFCSRACANSRVQTEEMNSKRRLKLKKDKPIYYCTNCNKKLFKKTKHGYCRECYFKLVPYSDEHRKKQSIAMKGRSRWNIHRNQPSFAEKFFMKVLENNNIDYSFEHQVKKSDDYHCYSLDFLIQTNTKLIDLEIDGLQHKDRVESDLERDTYLTSIGYDVYRIPWNEINSEKGKQQMKEKIDSFLAYMK